MSTAGSPITAGPLKWSDILVASCNVQNRCSIKPSSAFSPGTNRYSPPFTLTKVGRSNRNGRLAPGTGHLRTFAADAVDRVLLVRIEPDELAALHPFVLHELELPFDVGLDEQVDQAAIDAVVLERAVREMRAVLDAAPDQPVPPAPRSRVSAASRAGCCGAGAHRAGSAALRRRLHSVKLLRR